MRVQNVVEIGVCQRCRRIRGFRRAAMISRRREYVRTKTNKLFDSCCDCIFVLSGSLK